MNVVIKGFISVTTFVFISGQVWAHCDTMGGPVVQTAKAALEQGDVTPVLKWVKPEYEPQIREAFSRTVTVRAQSPEARELADMYFFETLVRLHREGEGAPYEGLKPEEAMEPIVQLSDKALDAADVEKLVSMIGEKISQGIKERFAHALETSRHKNDSVAAGRKFVEAYVTFTHYVENLHLAAEGDAGHHEGE